MTHIFTFIGSTILSFLSSLEKFGAFIIFQIQLIPLFFKRPFRVKQIFEQLENIGVNTFWVIALTALFTGMVRLFNFFKGLVNLEQRVLWDIPFLSLSPKS